MPPPAEASVEAEKPKSKGAKAFDWGTYGGLAGVGTFVVTIPVTYLLKYHGKVSPYFERAVDGLHRGLTKLFPSIKRETADTILTTTALMQGGNAMLIPVGLLEKHKVPIVSGLNTMLGDPTPAEQIEKAPKQTWRSLLESRAVAWLAVYAAFRTAAKFVPNTLAMFEHEVGERMCQLFKKPIERLVDGKMVKSKTYLFGKIGALDFFATIAAATLLYVGGHFFARKQEERKERRASGHVGPLRAEGEEDAPAVNGAELAAAPSSQVSGQKHVAGTMSAAPGLHSALQG